MFGHFLLNSTDTMLFWYLLVFCEEAQTSLHLLQAAALSYLDVCVFKHFYHALGCPAL